MVRLPHLCSFLEKKSRNNALNAVGGFTSTILILLASNHFLHIIIPARTSSAPRMITQNPAGMIIARMINRPTQAVMIPSFFLFLLRISFPSAMYFA